MKEEQVRRFYSDLWSKYIPDYSASEKHWEIFYQPHEVRGKSVLDAGCGTGIFSFIFDQKGASQVLGIDISEGSLEAAQKLKKRHECQNTSFQRVNMLKLPFQDGSFDIVWAWGAVHHTTEPFPALEELIRVLKEQGSLLISTYRKTGLTFLHEMMRKSLHRLPRRARAPLSRILSSLLAPAVFFFKKREKSRKGEKLEELILDWYFVPIRHYFLPAEIKTFLLRKELVIEKYLPYSGRFNSTSNFIFKARKK
jgi:ubiquinone/menaquinone biosynthesis C-methylase UbiE